MFILENVVQSKLNEMKLKIDEEKKCRFVSSFKFQLCFTSSDNASSQVSSSEPKQETC